MFIYCYDYLVEKLNKAEHTPQYKITRRIIERLLNSKSNINLKCFVELKEDEDMNLLYITTEELKENSALTRNTLRANQRTNYRDSDYSRRKRVNIRANEEVDR